MLNAVGSITTSWSLRTLVAVLVNNPHIQRALQEEADHVMGEDLPRIKYRQHMPYTDAVKNTSYVVNDPCNGEGLKLKLCKHVIFFMYQKA